VLTGCMHITEGTRGLGLLDIRAQVEVLAAKWVVGLVQGDVPW
jgi:hypothetical protein